MGLGEAQRGRVHLLHARLLPKNLVISLARQRKILIPSPLMELVSLCPLHAWGFVWQSQDGRHAQTVVVKATFTLAPGKVTLAEEQDVANEEDGYWNDDPTRSVVAPSDKAPYKLRADVLLVGHAYAPNKQATRSVMARLIVGDLDKAIEVFCDRAFRIHDGQLLEGQRFTKMRLSWERAAGGVDVSNPIGLRFDAPPDSRGMIPIPNLQPPGLFVSKRSDVFAPVCYGPIAPSWPGRKDRLSRAAVNFPRPGWTETALPEGLDPTFFQVAPTDQQVAELRPNERIVLENLHPEHPRLVTSLPGLRPRALVERATGEREEVALVADTLLIDTDRGVCVVVWRGRIGLRHAQEAGRISVTMAEEAEMPPQRAPMPTVAFDSDEDDDVANGLTTIVPPSELTRPAPPGQKTFIPGLTATGTHARVMPFVGADQPAPRPAAQTPRPSDAALPFMRKDQPPSTPSPTPAGAGAMPWPMSAGPAIAPPVAPPMGAPPGLPPGQVVPPLKGAPPLPGQVVPPLPISPAPVAVPSPLPVAVAVPAAPISLAPIPPAVVPTARPSTPESVASPWASGAAPGTAAAAATAAVGLGVGVAAVATVASTAKAGSAQALSDAAADAQTRAAPAPQAVIKPIAPTNTNKFHRLPSNDVLDLLWYDDAFVPRIRANWEELVTELDFEPADPRKDLNAEDPEKTRTRHNVFGILTDGEMVEPSGISRVINEAVNQKGRFTPPLTLTGGELRFPFDEVETLKAMIVAMTPFLGSDKRLKEMVDGMTELLKTPYLQGSTGIVDKLVRDLRNQFRESNKSLPSTYLDGHVERLLLEQRRYAIRKVFGGEFIRGLLTVYVSDGFSKGSDASIPVYMPKSLDQTLPMLVSMKVRLIVECHLQQDPYDTSPYALRTVALGRAYQLDALRSGAKTGS